MKDSEFREMVSAHLDGELDVHERDVLRALLRDDVERYREYEELSRIHRASMVAMGSDRRLAQPGKRRAAAAKASKVVRMDGSDYRNVLDTWVIRLMTGAVAAAIVVTVAVIGMDLQERREARELANQPVDALSEMAQAQAREAAREGAMREFGLSGESSVEEIEAFLASMDASELRMESFDPAVSTFSASDPNAGLVDRFQLTGLNSDSGIANPDLDGGDSGVISEPLIIVP